MLPTLAYERSEGGSEGGEEAPREPRYNPL
jgi:hypothetical protein